MQYVENLPYVENLQQRVKDLPQHVEDLRVQDLEHVEEQINEHPALKGFALFGGLSVALGWTLYVVWVVLVSLAEEIRKIQG